MRGQAEPEPRAATGALVAPDLTAHLVEAAAGEDHIIAPQGRLGSGKTGAVGLQLGGLFFRLGFASLRIRQFVLSLLVLR